MAKKTFIFEQPLNERVRIFMRIEALINRLEYFKNLNNDTASYHAILSILEITSLVERGDIKQEIIKELERQHRVLSTLLSHQGVDKSRLQLTLSKLKSGLNKMHSMDGKLGEHLKKIDFLLSIKQRASIPGGSCDFDLPQLRYWLNLDYKIRTEHIERWSAPYTQLHDMLEMALKIIRDSGHAEKITAQNGFFQEALDTSQPNQLLRIELPCEAQIFPEISAGKHRYSIRFLQSQNSVDQIPAQFKQDVEFKLFRCSL
jgi:cell division protein ZapD